MYTIWQILKRFAGIFLRAQTLELVGVYQLFGYYVYFSLFQMHCILTKYLYRMWLLIHFFTSVILVNTGGLFLPPHGLPVHDAMPTKT